MLADFRDEGYGPETRERFGSLLAAGLTMCIATQAAINIAVTTCLLPNKGMPLPFISAGGSNLCLCLFALGLLVSIHRASPVYLGAKQMNAHVSPVAITRQSRSTEYHKTANPPTRLEFDG